jgi:hypothetical protein
MSLSLKGFWSVFLNWLVAKTGVLWVFFFYYWWGGTKSLGTVATSGLLYKPPMIDEDDCGAIGGIKIGRGNWSTWRKPAPAPLCPPQIPHNQTRARTPDRCGGKPATNRLSYGAALLWVLLELLMKDILASLTDNITIILPYSLIYYSWSNFPQYIIKNFSMKSFQHSIQTCISQNLEFFIHFPLTTSKER